MSLLYLLISILFCAAGILIGLACFFYPALVIEIQRRFYAKINWRMTPISMQKEIRNTKIMGLFLLAFSLLTAIYTLFLKTLAIPYHL